MSNSNRASIALLAAVLVAGLPGSAAAAQLDGPVTIVYDAYRVPTIVAQTEHDAIFMQGYLHAKDRLFQMDFQRRLFSGRVSELVGSAGIPQDVQLRTLGLRRAAERSLAVQTPETMAWLQAYADGVNAYLQDTTQPLPIEYGALEMNRAGIPAWTPLDSLTTAKGLAFGLSFDLGDINRTLALLNFRGVCNVLGCNGLQLYNDDLWRTAPFEAGMSIPPPPPPPGEPFSEPGPPPEEQLPAYMSDPSFETMLRGYRDTISEIPMLQRALEFDASDQGSNWWLASGAHTDSGFPMIASDPHLSLGTPATFYEIHLNVTGGINVTGTSFPGAPGVVIGCNDTICWGAAVNSVDVTDVYNEVLLALNPAAPTSPTHIYRADGPPEPLQFIPQTFFVNVIGDGVPNSLVNANVPATSGGVTMVVPRRNNGPIVQVTFNPASPTPLTGISVAYVGWSATQELETFRRFARASTMQQFKDALQFFDFGSQNWSYADINGNIAYYTSGEVPIREDLQTLFFPAGLQPPALIRDGTHTNKHDWLPLAHPQPNQALSTEILPFSEMPQIENPAAGYILIANNDPIGTTFDNVAWNQFRVGFNGLLYLSSGYDTGYRIGRLQRLFNQKLAGGGTVSMADFASIQANNQLLDAEILTPYLLTAYANATALGAPPELSAIVADPRVGDAISRLAAWNYSTPTGIDQGFDPGDNPAAPGPPSAAEVQASVAATIYSVWRGQVVQRVIDSTLQNLPVNLVAYTPPSAQAMSALRRLLENYPINGGTGASLINFFRVPGVVDQNVARDIILLQSLLNGLNLLASNDFAAAYANSTNLDDYRWGKLHRIVFAHNLGGPFNVPPPGSPQNVSPTLPGFARSGGMGSVDAASHEARADRPNEFMFSSGPARRLIATMRPDGPDAKEVIPGGESGAPGNPHGTDQLALWLVNAYKPLPVSLDDVNANAVDRQTIACGDGTRGPGEACDDGNTNNADGCDTSCRFSAVIHCSSPTAPGSATTCTASFACSTIATCVDSQTGAAGTVSCDSGGPFGFGTSSVTVQCTDSHGTVSTSCPVNVTDVTPPSISIDPVPNLLWPPNHHMVQVDAHVSTSDNCGPAAITLTSATSDEPDDGPGDGTTVGDVQAATGTNATVLSLRAEREGPGDGRVYTIVYTATDAGGNQVSATSTIDVPHDLGGLVDPVNLRAAEVELGTQVSWTGVPNALYYNVVRTRLSQLREDAVSYNLGPATCIEARSTSLDTYRHFDQETPPPGEVFVYMVEFFDGLTRSTYGTASAAKPRVVAAGDCE